ncbi:hypothetical protein M8818_003375 [Zalaria obscura]|uniref:Uncharacterized protein n=1 Tax=Zalaria obscura TaxID=2024903 RepID=A0ACC3SFU4_9PEZI
MNKKNTECWLGQRSYQPPPEQPTYETGQTRKERQDVSQELPPTERTARPHLQLPPRRRDRQIRQVTRHDSIRLRHSHHGREQRATRRDDRILIPQEHLRRRILQLGGSRATHLLLQRPPRDFKVRSANEAPLAAHALRLDLQAPSPRADTHGRTDPDPRRSAAQVGAAAARGSPSPDPRHADSTAQALDQLHLRDD